MNDLDQVELNMLRFGCPALGSMFASLLAVMWAENGIPDGVADWIICFWCNALMGGAAIAMFVLAFFAWFRAEVSR